MTGEVVPVFTFPEGEISFSFKALGGSGVGTVVGTITAIDDMSSTFTYSLLGAGGSDFTVDDSGQMTVSTGASLSLSTRPRYSLTVTATDGDGNVSSSVDLGVTLLDPSVNVGNTRLIDVSSLAQLNVIRYDLDGDGTPYTSNETDYRSLFSVSQSTCKDGSSLVPCEGYELMNDLDFDNLGGWKRSISREAVDIEVVNLGPSPEGLLRQVEGSKLLHSASNAEVAVSIPLEYFDLV